MEKDKRKQMLKFSIFIVGILLIFLSVTYAFQSMIVQGTKRQIVTAGTLSIELQEDANELAITDALPMYDEVGMIQDPFTFRLINNTNTEVEYILKIQPIQVDNTLDSSIVKYGLTKGSANTIDFVSNITDDTIDRGVIGGDTTIEYALRLWIDSNVEDEGLIKDKTLKYKIVVKATQEEEQVEIGIGTVAELAFSEENLGSACKIYDDGIDTFLVGQCKNNYVWYSGKLWRVVLKNNETGAVKMVTDKGITVIPYNVNSNSTFENSDVDYWLRQEFLPTLHDYTDYLVINSVWDSTLSTNTSPLRPDNSVTVIRTVGLLNLYEFYTTYVQFGGSLSNQTTYLITGSSSYTLTPANDTSVHTITWRGTSGQTISSTTARDVRPAVYLKSSIEVVTGVGTQENPYKLIGDIQYTEGGSTLLNTRYSGEYVSFNNELYRIVGLENTLTKITAADKPSIFSSSKFHSAKGVSNFTKASIGTDLENYYQNLDSKYKDMIEANTLWYLGMMGEKANYKSTICEEVAIDVSTYECKKTTDVATANIGLPRIGEMFTSHISRATSEKFWTLTPFTSANPIGINSYDGLSGSIYTYSTNTYGARPSIYLKSNVVISKNNTGDGTYEHPYEIELAS